MNLSVKAAGRIAACSWEYATDQKTRTSLLITLEAKTGVSGLTPATTYYFRVQALVRTRPDNWSHVVALLVR